MAINSFYLKAYSKKRSNLNSNLGKNHLLNYISFQIINFSSKIFFNIISSFRINRFK